MGKREKSIILKLRPIARLKELTEEMEID